MPDEPETPKPKLKCAYPWCDAPAKYWIAKDNLDGYTYACKFHVEEMQDDDDFVWPL